MVCIKQTLEKRRRKNKTPNELYRNTDHEIDLRTFRTSVDFLHLRCGGFELQTEEQSTCVVGGVGVGYNVTLWGLIFQNCTFLKFHVVFNLHQFRVCLWSSVDLLCGSFWRLSWHQLKAFVQKRSDRLTVWRWSETRQRDTQTPWRSIYNVFIRE